MDIDTGSMDTSPFALFPQCENLEDLNHTICGDEFPDKTGQIQLIFGPMYSGMYFFLTLK